MKQFLAATEIVDWRNPTIRSLADELAVSGSAERTIEQCFRWVRDEITHSFDVATNRVTFKASDVLEHGTGICFAKANLLAALLRANEIPAGFGYQRLTLDVVQKSYCLHGFNYVWLEPHGWHSLDARGNRQDISTSFEPPRKSFAFSTDLPGKNTFEQIFEEQLPVVVTVFGSVETKSELEAQLPDWNSEIT